MLDKLTLSLILLPTPLMAQDAQVDVAIVAACLEGTPPGYSAPACIGDAALACSQAHEQPQTTLAISQCMMAENAAWDDLLNDGYQNLRSQWSDQPGLAESLLQAQRAWIAFRDADCHLAHERFGNGSMRVIAAADCQMRHSARRSLELRHMQGM